MSAEYPGHFESFTRKTREADSGVFISWEKQEERGGRTQGFSKAHGSLFRTDLDLSPPIGGPGKTENEIKRTGDAELQYWDVAKGNKPSRLLCFHH